MLPSRIVLDRKRNGSYEARLVAGGHRQQQELILRSTAFCNGELGRSLHQSPRRVTSFGQEVMAKCYGYAMHSMG
jgi:hypothetical protein